MATYTHSRSRLATPDPTCGKTQHQDRSEANGQGRGLGDPEIRNALLVDLSRKYLGDPETALIEELGLCRGTVRVDLVVVNGALHGFEIKSDRDSLARLENQVEVYSKVLDHATLVVGRRHAAEATSLLPEWWGVVIADETPIGVQLRRVREDRWNPSRDARALVELVWLDDARRLLDAKNALRGFRGRPRRHVWSRVCELYGLDEIAEIVRSHLRTRFAAEAVRQPA